MAPTGRVGTGLLGTFGLALAALMAYTLAFEGGQGPGSGPEVVRDRDTAEVAVFFPDSRDWSHFRRAIAACVGRGLARPVVEGDEAVVVETARLGRRVRFSWRGIRGLGETREEVDRLASRPRPPVAIVGSSTTVLTVALAEALRDAGSAGPVLLVPWATALTVDRPGSGRGKARLLDIDRGRTFRFCPDNRQLAESVVGCLLGRDAGRPPGRVFLVVDPHDPYSVDLTDCFRHAIREKAGAVEIVDRADAVGVPTVSRPPGSVPNPSATESSLADEVWTSAEDGPADRTTWVVLPLQGEPTRRLLAGLRRRASWHSADEGDGPLRVVCGDGIGRETLDGPTGDRPFPIWCASTSTARAADHGVSNDTQTLAEIVSAVLLAVERSPTAGPSAGDIRRGLMKLDLPEGDRAAFGRPLRFGADGERLDDPGHVLAARPGSAPVEEFRLGPAGRWVADRGGP